MRDQGGDQRGTVCRNCDPALAGRSDSGQPNGNEPIAVNPNTELVAGAWEEYADKHTKLKYWYNTVTQVSTWEDPMVPAKKPPPPPSTPPPPSP